MEEFYKRVWLDWASAMIEECHKEIICDLVYNFSIQDRTPDENNLNFIFSIFGS